MFLQKLDHIGIAVKSIEGCLDFYSGVLGLEVETLFSVAEQGIKTCMLKIGNTKIELLESTTEGSPIAKYIEKRGEGIHHICFEVEDIETSLHTLERKGITLIDKTPRMGAEGKKIAFLHPKSTHGVLIELTSVF